MIGGAWQAGTTINVAILDDALDEDDETFILKLGYHQMSAEHTPLVDVDGNSCGTECQVTVTITDDDDSQQQQLTSVQVSFAVYAYTVPEGSSVEVTVNLSDDPGRTVTIPINKTNQDGASAADYSGVPTGVTFNSGDTEKTFTFSAIQDSVQDDGESVKLIFGTLPDGVTAGTPSETNFSITEGVAVSFDTATYVATEGGA